MAGGLGPYSIAARRQVADYETAALYQKEERKHFVHPVNYVKCRKMYRLVLNGLQIGHVILLTFGLIS